MGRKRKVLEGDEAEVRTGSGESKDTRAENVGSGKGSGGQAEGEQFDKVLAVNLVDLEVPEVKKPRKKRETKKETILKTEDLNAILQGVFGLVALKGGEHWNIDIKESEMISKPLLNIIEKLDLSEKISNISDGTALVIALLTITAPRVIISVHQSKQKKEGIKVLQGGQGENDKGTKVADNSGENNQRTRTENADGGSIKALVNLTSTEY
jgi:hypothetical protein